MTQHPLPIRGLPLAAPPAPGLHVMDDVIQATSSHPRKPIAPIPLTKQAAAVATATATAVVTTPAEAKAAKHPHGECQPPQNRPRPQAAAATTKAAISTAANTADEPSRLPARRYRKAIPELVPIQPESFTSHHHPLTIRTARDVVRFFPFAVSAAAALAGLSGLLAGAIANRVLGGDVSPVFFMAGYLALFLLNFLTHCFSAKGQLFFQNRRRFLRLLVANALLFLPHFITYSILTSLSVK